MKLLTIFLLVSRLNLVFAQGSLEDPMEIELASSDVLSASSVHKAAASETLTNKLHHKSSQVEDAEHLYVKSIKSMKVRQIEKGDGVDGRVNHVDRSPKIKQLRGLKRLPQADGYLHVYALPVGDGDAQILQCPNGDIAIVDLGSMEFKKSGFWMAEEISEFLKGHNDRIKNIVISLIGYQHYSFSFFKDVFPGSKNLSGLRNIYIPCIFGDMSLYLKNWIKEINASNKLRTFNGGRTCGSPNGKPCESIALCPENPEVVTRVLLANAGNCSGPRNTVDSIVLLIKYNTFTMLLSGDFEDYTANPMENGPQKQLVDFYKANLQTTVYKIPNHGFSCYANKPILLDAVRPKAVFVSSNPWPLYLRCSITDHLIAKKYLCKPAETDSANEFYCGKHPVTDVTIADKLQQEFACGMPKIDRPCVRGGIRAETANEFAIYSTTPSKDKMNLVHLLTDGTKWGFVNNIQPIIPKPKME